MAAPARPTDTPAAVFATQLDRYRAMSPAEKAAVITALTQTACAFSLAGLRARHPNASQRELLLRLAVLRLGAPAVQAAYGWRDGDGA